MGYWPTKYWKKSINAEDIDVSLSPVRQDTGRLELCDTSQQKIGKKSINADETDVFLSPVSELWDSNSKLKSQQKRVLRTNKRYTMFLTLLIQYNVHWIFFSPICKNVFLIHIF